MGGSPRLGTNALLGKQPADPPYMRGPVTRIDASLARSQDGAAETFRDDLAIDPSWVPADCDRGIERDRHRQHKSVVVVRVVSDQVHAAGYSAHQLWSAPQPVMALYRCACPLRHGEHWPLSRPG